MSDEKKKITPPFPENDNGVKKPVDTRDVEDYAKDVVTEDAEKKVYNKHTIKTEPEVRAILKNGFPSNAHSDKKKTDEKKVSKVISGGVVKRKKGLGKRLTETFVGEDVDNVAQYIIHDVLIPSAKNMITDMVQGGIEMLLFGERKGTRTSRDRGRSYVSYNSYSNRDNGRRDDRRDVSTRSRARHNFDEIVLSSRGEAEEVLSCLVDLTEDYGQATVADLYDLVGLTGNFTDNKWGWTNLSSASVSRARDGYLLNLPKTIQLD